MELLSVALCVPHAAWVPERAAHMIALRKALGIVPWVRGDEQRIAFRWPQPCNGSMLLRYREFSEKEEWHDWFQRMLQWGDNQDTDWLVSLQDDVEVAPEFWPALRAMMTAWPGEVISLAATHSGGPEVARQGRHSYRTPNLFGWGWALPRAVYAKMAYDTTFEALQAFSARLPGFGEDAYMAEYLAARQIVPRHPCPTIVQHVMHSDSTVARREEQPHRQSTVTWHGYPAEDLSRPAFWQTEATFLPLDLHRRCAWCGEREVAGYSLATRTGMCARCIVSPYAIDVDCIQPSMVEVLTELRGLEEAAKSAAKKTYNPCEHGTMLVGNTSVCKPCIKAAETGGPQAAGPRKSDEGHDGYTG